MEKHTKKYRMTNNKLILWWNSLSTGNKILNSIIAGATVVAVTGIIVAITPKGANNSKKQETANSVVSSSKKKNQASSKDKHSDAVSESDVIIAKNADGHKRPNEGKTLYFNTVEEAEAAINQHAATCPYGRGQAYTGLVYAGTYFCKCGLKIKWYDQAVKEAIETGHSDDPRARTYIDNGNDADEQTDNDSSSSPRADNNSESTNDNEESTSPATESSVTESDQ